MKNKILLALLLCFAMILTGCSNKDKIKTKIKIDEGRGAKDFVVYSPYNSLNPFGKYLEERGVKREFKKDNAEEIRYLNVNGTSLELSYQSSTIDWTRYCDSDCYTLSENENIKIKYYYDADIVFSFQAVNGASLKSIFPDSGFSFDTEEQCKAYSENIARIVDFDLSKLACTVTTRIADNDNKYINYDGYYIPGDDEELLERTFTWKKEYNDEFSMDAFIVSFAYDSDKNARVTDVIFPPYAEKIFDISSDEIKELVLSKYSVYAEIINEPIYCVVCNKLCIAVGVGYGDGTRNEISAAADVYVFPSDVTFP